MRFVAGQLRRGWRARIVLATAVLTLLSGCMREDEAELRHRLERWFALGETLYFSASKECVAASFRLVQWQFKAPMPIEHATPQALRTLSRAGLVALDNSSLAPDDALLDFVNSDRTIGMGMRRAALEGRLCMNDDTESAFRYALDSPRAVLAFDAENAMLMLLDPHSGLLVVAQGAVEWM